VKETEESPDRLSFDRYEAWLATKCEHAQLANARARFETVGDRMISDISHSDEWRALLDSYRDIEDQYTRTCGFKLFATPEPPTLTLKPYDSLLSKSYRKNVLANRDWPKPPASGWITPENWYQKTNDVVRTAIVVKYLDGVEFLVEHIRRIANDGSRTFSVDYEARDEGYYAAHCYVTFDLEVRKLDWDTERVPVRVEIQITTQLQDVIRKLTHQYYENRRMKDASDLKWQWNYTSPEFVPNYLGHILHYVEGMIMEVRMRGEG
jgi:ppGpp synthetase/RelA/SpoT-type nucleotidyltranferase